MSDPLSTWREKLAHLLEQEALATATDRFTIAKQIDEARAKIAELVDSESSGAPPDTTEPRVDISHIARYAPSELIGRDEETSLLKKTLAQMKRGTKTRPRVLMFVALGGEGKTALVTDWVVALTQKPANGCDRVYAWSFYSQGSREQVAVSSDQFLAAAIRFFAESDEERQFADSNAGAPEKGERLAGLIGRRRNLLILDGLEPLQYPDGEPHDGRLKEGNGMYELLSRLAMSPGHGLCVITTRYAIPDLKAWVGKSVHEHPLLRLSREAGVAFLLSIGVEGSLRRPEPSDENPDGLNEFEALVEDVDGHALTLQILGQYLMRAHRGDIRRRDRIDFAKADQRIPGGPGFHTHHAFGAIAAYEAWLANDSEEARRELAVLRLLGLFDRPATAGCVRALLAAPSIDGLTDPLVDLPDEDWEFALTTLSEAPLLSVNRDDATGELLSLDAHPLIREYFAHQLRRYRRQKEEGYSSSKRASGDGSYEETDTTGEVWRTAHRRLYEHLCEATKEGDEPTLEDLQPLYQAVAHGCHAGLQAEARRDVYIGRILRVDEFYSSRKLGALGSNLGAIAGFYAKPWSAVTAALPAADQAWVSSEAAFYLRALGRLRESLGPMRAGLGMRIKLKDWVNAAIRAGNLSELELALGEVSDAVSTAERSVTYADRSGDTFQRMHKRARHADALHQSGRRSEAESLFREAEQMQVDEQPDYPLLYSLSGFQYCDLQLAPAEREAWRVTLGGGDSSPISFRQGDDPIDDSISRTHLESRSDAKDVAGLHEKESSEKSPHTKACRAVTNRARQALVWTATAGRDILSATLNHLTLSRAALYECLLNGAEVSDSESHISSLSTEIEAAVSGLRRAGHQHYLSQGLLTRASQRSVLGRNTGADSAQSDLDEAWEIASRGPMPLFLADIHLHRARLFGIPCRGARRRVDRPPPGDGPTPSDYPWESVEHDLSEARRLIEKHGYGRRLDELNDAEEALRGFKA